VTNWHADRQPCMRGRAGIFEPAALASQCARKGGSVSAASPRRAAANRGATLVPQRATSGGVFTAALRRAGASFRGASRCEQYLEGVGIRSVALARHFRECEGLSIAQIAERLGRAPSTIKAYFYDPSDDNKRHTTDSPVGAEKNHPARRSPGGVVSALACIGRIVLRTLSSARRSRCWAFAQVLRAPECSS
jgi:hypothetical protein